jgi:hypothetical protein
VRFRKRDVESQLESELRSGRPEPRDAFVRALVGRVSGEARHARLRTNARRVAVVAVTVPILLTVASFGGIGYAASSAVDVVQTAKRVVVAPAKQKLRQVNKSAAQDQYKPEKVTICHRTGSGKPVTITISRSALPAHLAHGDTIGPCP